MCTDTYCILCGVAFGVYSELYRLTDVREDHVEWTDRCISSESSR